MVVVVVVVVVVATTGVVVVVVLVAGVVAGVVVVVVLVAGVVLVDVLVGVVVSGTTVVVVVSATTSFRQISFLPTFLQTSGFFLVPAIAPAREQIFPTLVAETDVVGKARCTIKTHRASAKTLFFTTSYAT